MTAPASPPAFARASAADEDAIRATVADYYLGWFDGDADRMARALHADLVKRGWLPGPGRDLVLTEDSRSSMVDATAAGIGRRGAPAERAYEVGPIVVYGDIASAHVHAVPYVDYLHLVRTSDGWRILHAIWCRP